MLSQFVIAHSVNDTITDSFCCRILISCLRNLQCVTGIGQEACFDEDSRYRCGIEDQQVGAGFYATVCCAQCGRQSALHRLCRLQTGQCAVAVVAVSGVQCFRTAGRSRACVHMDGNHQVRNLVGCFRSACVIRSAVIISGEIYLNVGIAFHIRFYFQHHSQVHGLFCKPVAAGTGVIAAVTCIQQKDFVIYLLRVLCRDLISAACILDGISADDVLVEADDCIAAAGGNGKGLDRG